MLVPIAVMELKVPIVWTDECIGVHIRELLALAVGQEDHYVAFGPGSHARMLLLTPTLTPTGARISAFQCASVRAARIQTGRFDRGRDGFESRLPLSVRLALLTFRSRGIYRPRGAPAT